MSRMTRRGFTRQGLAGLGALAGLGLAPKAILGQARPKVVVIGGGPGGATAAKYLALDSQGAIDVTLVEPQQTYTTCFYSNLFLGGLWPFEALQHGYGALARHGVTVVHDRASAIDPAARTVTLAGGATLAYDRLVVAPGIAMRWNAIEGYDAAAAEVMPHAFQAGAQTRLLKRQIESMEDGGVVVVTVPAMPYRCPPGPYERVCMIAWYLKNRKPRSKILVLDAKDSFSKQALFTEAWNHYYPGMVEWVPAEFGGKVTAVHAASGEIVAEERHRAHVANVIPPQKAGEIAEAAGLTNETGWCPIIPARMESALQPGIHVLGDATIAADMPKSAFSANSQAKVVVMLIRAELTGARAFPPRYRNTCWSSVAGNDAVKIGANYRPTADKLEAFDSFISEVGESEALRRETRAEADGWYTGIVQDVWG